MIRHGMQIPRTATTCLTPSAKAFLNKPWMLQISLFCESNKPPHKKTNLGGYFCSQFVHTSLFHVKSGIGLSVNVELIQAIISARGECYLLLYMCISAHLFYIYAHTHTCFFPILWGVLQQQQNFADKFQVAGQESPNSRFS